MGTNYYWIRNKCECCGKGDKYHIGKSCGGWEFMFNAPIIFTDSVLQADGTYSRATSHEIKSWQEWKEILKSEPAIEDEYGDTVTLDDLIGIVECREGVLHDREGFDSWGKFKNHYDYCMIHHSTMTAEMWKDAEGYSFQWGEFS